MVLVQAEGLETSEGPYTPCAMLLELAPWGPPSWQVTVGLTVGQFTELTQHSAPLLFLLPPAHTSVTWQATQKSHLCPEKPVSSLPLCLAGLGTGQRPHWAGNREDQRTGLRKRASVLRSGAGGLSPRLDFSKRREGSRAGSSSASMEELQRGPATARFRTGERKSAFCVETARTGHGRARSGLPGGSPRQHP